MHPHKKSYQKTTYNMNFFRQINTVYLTLLLPLSFIYNYIIYYIFSSHKKNFGNWNGKYFYRMMTICDDFYIYLDSLLREKIYMNQSNELIQQSVQFVVPAKKLLMELHAMN